jgi:hypothetical protein
VVFAHQKFEVVPDTAAEPERAIGEAIGLWASVRFDDREVRVRWETARDYIHCVGQLVRREHGTEASGPETPRRPRRVLAGILGDGHAVGGALTSAEQASVHSTASARVRLLARRLMDRCDLQGAEIVRLWRAWGWTPPVVSRHGRPVAGFDVSLSHDGRFVAAVLAGPSTYA